MSGIIDYLRQLNIFSMMLRIFLAMIMGGIIGLERERHRRPAGFRTYMLVALGASMTVMLSQYLSIMLNGAWAETAKLVGVNTDVSRFGAQVINGVGFLGAGTIIVTGRQEVKGLTTAAGLWASACMGLAIGAGFYECMTVGFALIVLCMEVLPDVEAAILENARNINIYVELESFDALGVTVNKLKAAGIKLFDVEIEKEQHAEICQVNALISAHLPGRQHHTEVLAMLSTVGGIISIEEV